MPGPAGARGRRLLPVYPQAALPGEPAAGQPAGQPGTCSFSRKRGPGPPESERHTVGLWVGGGWLRPMPPRLPSSAPAEGYRLSSHPPALRTLAAAGDLSAGPPSASRTASVPRQNLGSWRGRDPRSFARASNESQPSSRFAWSLEASSYISRPLPFPLRLCNHKG